MDEQFTNALAIATNVGGEDFKLIELTYHTITGTFIAKYTKDNGFAYLDTIDADVPYKKLRKQLEQSWRNMNGRHNTG